MVMKAGANNTDKSRIRKMVAQGLSDEQISATCSVRLPHVRAIRAQIEAGTLKIGRGSAPSYGLGDSENGDVVYDPTAAVAVVNQHQEQEIADLQRQLEEERANKKSEPDIDEESAQGDLMKGAKAGK